MKNLTANPLQTKIDIMEAKQKMYWEREHRECKKNTMRLFEQSPKIIPDRYLWHLSIPKYRKCILKEGIIPNHEKYDLVFANNQIHQLCNLWPLVWVLPSDTSFRFDDYSNEDEAYKAYNEFIYGYYDFWRIDSEIAGYDGYRIDPNNPAVEGASSKLPARDEDYICRKEPIPPNSLKLFRYRPNTFLEYHAYLFGESKKTLIYETYPGVVSVGGFDKARPYYLQEYQPLEYRLAA